MDKATCLAWVKKYIPKYQKKLLLNDWNITFECVPLDDSTEAMIDYEASYMSAHIKFNNERVTNNRSLENTVRHELLHLYHAEFDTLDYMLKELIEEKSFNAVAQFINHCQEMIVLRIEKMLDFKRTGK